MHEILHVLKGILGPVVLFGFVVFIHELGHFLVAKLSGVGVKKFAIGFGPKIFAWTAGETEYSVRWIPLGGFVALKGMIEGLDEEEELEKAVEETVEDAGEKKEPAKVEEKQGFQITEDMDALRNRSPLVRIAVFGAGVTFNFITAIVFCALYLAYGSPKPVEMPPRVERVPVDSPWYAAGWRTGDEIISVERAPLSSLGPALESEPREEGEEQDVPIRSWSDVLTAISEAGNPAPLWGSSTLNAIGRLVGLVREKPTTVTLLMHVDRDGKEFTLPWSTALRNEDPETFSSALPPYVAYFTPNSAAHRARLVADNYELGAPVRPMPTWEEMPEKSLQANDRILGIDTGGRLNDMQPIKSWSQMTGILRAHPRDVVYLLVERKEDNQVRHLLLATVLERSEADPNRGILGIAPGLPPSGEWERMPVGQAIMLAPVMALRITDQIIYQTAAMLTRSWREISRNVGGPVLIGILAYKSAQQGLSNYLQLFAVISIVLAVMNLLPIPVLDGGYIVITIIEAIIGRPLPPKFLAGLLTTFMVLFMLLFVLIFYNDFMNWIIRP